MITSDDQGCLFLSVEADASVLWSAKLCVPEFGERICFCRTSLKLVDTIEIGTKVIELGPVLVCGVQTFSLLCKESMVTVAAVCLQPLCYNKAFPSVGSRVFMKCLLLRHVV